MEGVVTVEAYKDCAYKMKVSKTPKDLGIEVKYMSKLTGLIKKKEHQITILLVMFFFLKSTIMLN